MASIIRLKQNAWQDVMVAHGIIPALRSLRKEDSFEFEASLGCFSFNGGGFFFFRVSY